MSVEDNQAPLLKQVLLHRGVNRDAYDELAVEQNRCCCAACHPLTRAHVVSATITEVVIESFERREFDLTPGHLVNLGIDGH